MKRILIEQGDVRLESESDVNARGRVLSARLAVLQGETVLWEGDDTPAAVDEWKPILSDAIAGQVKAETKPKKKKGK